jgi:hypothetical protein
VRGGCSRNGIGVAFSVLAMKPAINTNKHADDLGSSSPQRSPANKVLVILATVVLTLVVGSGVVRSGTGTFNALISLR